jgi:glycerol-3-phosphate acyltransferase PlsX
MVDKIGIAIDAMGGSGGPSVIAKALKSFINSQEDVFFHIFGKKNILKKELEAVGLEVKNYRITDCQDIVSDNDKPNEAWRKGKSSSMRKAIEAVRDKKAEAIVSCGNTGALMLTAKMILKTLPHIKRPSIIAVIPSSTSKGTVMLDIGANIECSEEHLFHFAIMGCCFAKIILETDNPSIGILNVGSEQMKGRLLEQKTYALLQESQLNFTGFVEGHEVVKHKVDVLVTDGFSGNIFLKASEGAAEMCLDIFKGAIKNAGFLGKFAAFLLKSKLKAALSVISPNKHNGAMLIGLNGIVVKSHGSANKEGIENALHVAYRLSKEKINERIEHELTQMDKKGISLNFVDKIKQKSAEILGIK